MENFELPATWRAGLIPEVGHRVELTSVKRPTLKRGQVAVRVALSGVCRSQLMEVRGLRGDDRWRPHLLGHEGVGTVVEVGPEVAKVAPGDEVILGWISGTGIEAEVPTFESLNGETIHAGRVTTFSEFTVVSENRVYLKPQGLSVRIAVLFGCALLTGGGMVLNEAKPRAGESVLINGLGGVGLAALVATQGLGARVIAADPQAEKRSIARALGAEFTIDPSKESLVEEVHRHFPDGVDVALDASGAVAGLESTFESLRFGGGRMIFASHPPAGAKIRLDPHDLIKGREIRGSWGGSSRPDVDIPLLAARLEMSKVSLDFMVPRSYPLDDINEALADLENGRALRPLIDMSP